MVLRKQSRNGFVCPSKPCAEFPSAYDFSSMYKFEASSEEFSSKRLSPWVYVVYLYIFYTDLGARQIQYLWRIKTYFFGSRWLFCRKALKFYNLPTAPIKLGGLLLPKTGSRPRVLLTMQETDEKKDNTFFSERKWFFSTFLGPNWLNSLTISGDGWNKNNISVDQLPNFSIVLCWAVGTIFIFLCKVCDNWGKTFKRLCLQACEKHLYNDIADHSKGEKRNCSPKNFLEFFGQRAVFAKTFGNWLICFLSFEKLTPFD